jgi:hypothetical protein
MGLGDKRDVGQFPGMGGAAYVLGVGVSRGVVPPETASSPTRCPTETV